MNQEPVFTEDVFEPEIPAEETIEDVINRAPQPIADTLKGLNLLLNPKPQINTGPVPLMFNPFPSMPAVEHKVEHFVIASDDTATRIESTLNDGWILKDSFINETYLILIFIRPIGETQNG